jgi:hypothetical protein
MGSHTNRNSERKKQREYFRKAHEIHECQRPSWLLSNHFHLFWGWASKFRQIDSLAPTTQKFHYQYATESPCFVGERGNN